MNQAEALREIKSVCDRISAEMMRLHPAVGALDKGPARDEFYRTLFELTKQLEGIKKLARKVESAGDTPPEL